MLDTLTVEYTRRIEYTRSICATFALTRTTDRYTYEVHDLPQGRVFYNLGD